MQIIYEDNHLLVVNKPAGLLVQGDVTGDITLSDQAAKYLKNKYNKPGNVFVGIPHRIDRPVSGLVIICRTSKSLNRVNQLFKEKKVNKTYWALTEKKPRFDSEKLIHWLIKDEQSNKVRVYDKEVKGGLKAELEYRILTRIGGRFLIKLSPKTGRPHQIRAQLSAIGTPIIGDLKYGYQVPNKDLSICLHALELEFEHPVKKNLLKFFAPLPENEYWEAFNYEDYRDL